jgi:DNA-binding transcriptional MocR family regulator
MGGDVLAQVVVADLLASGVLERHVRRVRRIHAARRAALLEALDAHMPEGTHWTRPSAGHLVWLRLPGDVDPDALAARAGEAGIAYGRGELCTLDDSGRDHLLLSFVNESTDALHAGVAALAELVSSERRTKRSA